MKKIFLGFSLLIISCSTRFLVNEGEGGDELEKKFKVKELPKSVSEQFDRMPKKKNILKKKKDIEKTKKTQLKSPILKKKETKKEAKTVAGPVLKKEEVPEKKWKYTAEDQKSLEMWSQFNYQSINDGEVHQLNISYLGIHAGNMTLTASRKQTKNGKYYYHFKGRLTSASYYKYIYSLDDLVESLVDSETFLPIRYSVIQRESGQKVDDLQVFDHSKRESIFWYYRKKKGKVKEMKVKTEVPEYFQDSFSVLYFLKGLPLKTGDKYRFPVVTRGKVWILKVNVKNRERLTVNNVTYPAIKILAETHFPGVLKKRGDIFFWFSDDVDKKVLKFQAKVKIGSIKGELVDYKRP